MSAWQPTGLPDFKSLLRYSPPPIPSIIQAGKMTFDFGITDIFHLNRFPDIANQTIKGPPVPRSSYLQQARP